MIFLLEIWPLRFLKLQLVALKQRHWLNTASLGLLGGIFTHCAALTALNFYWPLGLRSGDCDGIMHTCNVVLPHLWGQKSAWELVCLAAWIIPITLFGTFFLRLVVSARLFDSITRFTKTFFYLSLLIGAWNCLLILSIITREDY